MTVFTAAVLLFMVMDPFGNIPFFLSALKRVEPSRHLYIASRELLIALVVLLMFLFFGQQILRSLHITEPALTTGGGIVLFLIALRMIFPPVHVVEESPGEEPFVVPLAIPYVAGPSSMATVMLVMSQDPDRWAWWLLAVVGAWLAVGTIILAAVRFSSLLKPKILVAMERLMGMILVAIAVQMVMDGTRMFVQSFS